MGKELMLAGCPDCKATTPMKHLHDEAHGIAGTHMAGSEHYKCAVCGCVLTREQSEVRGLPFVLDTGEDND